MRFGSLLIVLAAALAVAVLPAMAGPTTTGKPAVTGNDNAVQRIEAATTRQVAILTALLSKVPTQAQPGIEKAIAAIQAAHDEAIADITGHEGSEADDATENESKDDDVANGENGGGKPEVTGLERARAAVAAGFLKSTTTLQGLLATVPSQAASHIQTALDRLDSTRTVALRNLDSLIAGDKPDHASGAERGERAETPSVPDRPDRPDRPERPQAPDRPERPQVPDHPAPAHG
jgi:hypothetical protein